jgi:hypothetical protein
MNENKRDLQKAVKRTLLKRPFRWELVTHACNPSYSEGRDQED